MKSINELYQEVKNDKELRIKFLNAYAKGETESFLKENGCEATPEEAQKFIEQELRPGSFELSDEELALVVGGNEKKPDRKYQDGQRIRYYRWSEYGDTTLHTGTIISGEQYRSGQWKYTVMRDGDSRPEYTAEELIEGLA